MRLKIVKIWHHKIEWHTINLNFIWNPQSSHGHVYLYTPCKKWVLKKRKEGGGFLEFLNILHPFKLQLLLWVIRHVLIIYYNVQVFIQNCIYKPFTKQSKVGKQSTELFCFMHIITDCKIWNWIWQRGALHNVELWKTTKQSSRNLPKIHLNSKAHNKTPFQCSMKPLEKQFGYYSVEIWRSTSLFQSSRYLSTLIICIHDVLPPIWQYFIHNVSSPYSTKVASGIGYLF